MLEHEFILLNNEQISRIKRFQNQTDIFCEFQHWNEASFPKLTTEQNEARKAVITILDKVYKKRRKEAICVRDSLILPRMECFGRIDTFFDGWLPYKGLNYYGFTVLPERSVSELEAVLIEIDQGGEFAPLLALCEKASATLEWLLHCGV